MEVSAVTAGLVICGGSALLSAGVAFGMVKGEMMNYVTYSRHQTMCKEKSEETNKVLTSIQEDIKQLIHDVGKLDGRTEK